MQRVVECAKCRITRKREVRETDDYKITIVVKGRTLRGGGERERERGETMREMWGIKW